MDETTHQPEQPFTRAQVIHTISDALTAGLPTPYNIRFHNDILSVDLDSAADLDAWSSVFNLDVDTAYRHDQAHPFPDNPAESDTWLTSRWGPWRGWHVSLGATDPITDDQRHAGGDR